MSEIQTNDKQTEPGENRFHDSTWYFQYAHFIPIVGMGKGGAY